jgi:hypothetical protein
MMHRDKNGFRRNPKKWGKHVGSFKSAILNATDPPTILNALDAEHWLVDTDGDRFLKRESYYQIMRILKVGGYVRNAGLTQTEDGQDALMVFNNGNGIVVKLLQQGLN